MKKTDPFNFPVCNKIEDVQHLVMECNWNKIELEVLLKELKEN